MRRYTHDNALGAGFTIALLVLIMLCLPAVPPLCAGSQQSCQSPGCGLLAWVPTLPMVTASWRRQPLVRYSAQPEHVLPPFRPPRFF